MGSKAFSLVLVVIPPFVIEVCNSIGSHESSRQVLALSKTSCTKYDSFPTLGTQYA